MRAQSLTGSSFTPLITLSIVAALGCADVNPQEPTDTFDSATSTSSESSDSADTMDGESSGDSMTGDSDPTTGDGDGDPSTGDGDGDPSTGDGDGDPPTGDGDGDEDSTGDGDEDPCAVDPMDAEVNSFIWVANSTESTVSKIDTKTGVELGRYYTREDQDGNPSRTSVNYRGDVVVANRNGGVTKIYANIEDCVEKNGMPGIQTSSGPDDILLWDYDECVAWHTPINANDNRPVAWTKGSLNEETCEYDQNVWTAWGTLSTPGSAVVGLLDGDTGEVLYQVPIADLPDTPGHGSIESFYGAAVDAEDNVYLSQLRGGWLVRVNAQSLTYDHWEVPQGGGYGMTVTPENYVFLCGASMHRFNPANDTWISSAELFYANGGCNSDGQGIIYRGSTDRKIYGVDVESLAIVRDLDVPPMVEGESDTIWGVAVDYQGYVWGLPHTTETAYRLDPETNELSLTVEGLVNAYTYSDMTGFALNAVNQG